MELIGMPIKSKFTGKKGAITGIDRKNLTVTFEYGGNINVPLREYDNLFTMSEEAKQMIDEHIESLKPRRKKAVEE